MELLLFNIKDKNFAIDTSKVLEILRPKDVTSIPEVPEYIWGVMNIRGSIGTVLSFRKLMGYKELSEEEHTNTESFIKAHNDYELDLVDCLKTGKEFKRTLDHTKCTLGKWIIEKSSCLSCDEESLNLLKTKLIPVHKAFHDNASHAIAAQKNGENYEEDLTKISQFHSSVEEYIRSFQDNIIQWTNTLQRIITIKNSKEETLNILVDSVEDIIKVEDKDLQRLDK
ncbi:MAG: chemotaxis protein CheW, partial [Campylobacterota bacterium]